MKLLTTNYGRIIEQDRVESSLLQPISLGLNTSICCIFLTLERINVKTKLLFYSNPHKFKSDYYYFNKHIKYLYTPLTAPNNSLSINNILNAELRRKGKGKEFKTHQELVELMKERNIDISGIDDTQLISHLHNVQYYTLVNSSKNIFTNTVFIDSDGFLVDDFKNTPITDLFKIYNFDRDLSTVLYKYIMHIEETFKSTLSYSISEKFSESFERDIDINGVDISYLARRNFLRTYSSMRADFKAMINEIQNDSIKYYQKEYKNIPPWILVNGLTFGKLIRWMKGYRKDTGIAEKVINQFIDPIPNLNDDQLASFFYECIYIVKEYRNIVSHCNRLCLHNSKKNIKKKYLFECLNYYSNRMYQKGVAKSNLLALLYAIDVLLLKRPTIRDQYQNDIKNEFKKLSQDSNLYAKFLKTCNIKQSYIDKIGS